MSAGPVQVPACIQGRNALPGMGRAGLPQGSHRKSLWPHKLREPPEKSSDCPCSTNTQPFARPTRLHSVTSRCSSRTTPLTGHRVKGPGGSLEGCQRKASSALGQSGAMALGGAVGTCARVPAESSRPGPPPARLLHPRFRSAGAFSSAAFTSR